MRSEVSNILYWKTIKLYLKLKIFNYNEIVKLCSTCLLFGAPATLEQNSEQILCFSLCSHVIAGIQLW